jgi:hypothetical protein
VVGHTTLVPISPGGIGTQQALLVYTLRARASRSALVAFSVGMKLTLTCGNLIVGFAAMSLSFRVDPTGCAEGGGSEVTDAGHTQLVREDPEGVGTVRQEVCQRAVRRRRLGALGCRTPG